MKYSNTIEYNITTKLDSSGLTKMQNQIREIELSLQRMGNKQGGFFAGQVEQARKELQGLNKALTEAFNPSLGIIDISKFRAELAKGKVDSEGLASAFRLAGTDGQVAFNNLISQLGTFDAGMRRSSSAVDKMWTTFQNTFRWGVVSSFFSQFMNAIHSSIDYVKELDDSLTQIMLVTDYNRDSMNQFAKSANEAAKAVSMTTTGMTNASLIFAQQGYDLEQSQELATLSAKVANASQQDTATTSDQITAYMNAYGLENNISELTQAMDNWALIANVSAADVGELAQASQRAASMANAVGVSGEALAAQIATIESVTRDAPEQIGNGLKTLYARFSDIASGKEDEDGFTLGKVTSELNKIGVQVLDEMGQIRDVGDIMEDLMVIWDDLDQTSKVAASQALAGKYQVNRFMALMDNSDMYEEYKGATGSAATGTLDQMNEEFADSIAGRSAKLQATLEGIFSSIFDTDTVYPFVDAMQTFLDLTQKFIEAIGGGGPVITGIIALIGRLFSKNIANAFVDTKINNNLSKIQAENYKDAPAAIAQLGLSNPNPENQNTKALLEFAQKGAEMAPNMSEQGLENYNRLLRENTQLSNQAAEAQQNFEDVISKVNAELGVNLGAKDSITKDESGLNVTPLLDILQQASSTEQFGQSSEYWEGATKAAQSYAEKLAEVHRELAEYRKIEDPSQDTTDKVKQKIKDLKVEIDALRGTSVQSSESIDQIEQTIDLLNGTLDETDKYTDDWKESLKDSSAEIEKLQSNAGVLIKILEELSKTGGLKDKSGIEALLNELYAAQSKATATQGAAEGGQRQMKSFISDTEDVVKVKNVVDMTSAIGELAFAWQSFQNLGSLWQKTDISTGEKIQQTIANLAASVPMLYTSWKKITETLKIPSFKDSTSNIQQAKNAITNAQNEIAQAQEKIDKANSKAQGGFKALSTTLHNTGKGAAGFAKKASNGMHEVVQAANEMDKAQKDAAAATADLRQAQLSLAGSLAFAAITVGLAIASAAWGAYQQKIQNAMAAEKEALDKAKATADETSSAVGEWQKLYDEYLKTGEASEALVSSSDQLSEKLGILGGDAYIAAGEFGKLADEIQRAADADAQGAIKEAKRLLDGTYGESLNGDIPLNGSAQEDYSKAFHDSIFSSTSQMLFGSGVSDAGAQLRDWMYEAELMPQAADTVADSIGKAHQALALIEEKQDEVNEKLKENPTDQALIDLADQLKVSHTALSEFLNLEDIKAAEDAYKTMAENTLRLSGTQKSLNERAENGMSGEELLDYISNLEGVSDYFKTLETDADKARFAINLLGEGAASASIELDSLFNEDNSGIFNNFSDKEKDSIKTSLKESELTPEEQLEIVVSIDEEQSLAEIQDFIEKVAEKVKNGTEISDAISEVINSLPMKELLFNSYSQEDIDAIFKKANLEDVNIDDYVNIFKEAGGAGVTKDQINVVAEEVDDLTASLKELEEAGDTSSDKYKSLQKDLQDAEGILQDLAIASLETSNGMDELSEKWEDISAAINSGDPGAMAGSYKQLQEILSELLNVDPSMITSEFMQNADVLSALGDLANGDTEAIWRLREAFGNEDLVLNARLDALGFEGDREKLFNLIKIAQEQLPELEVGAHLDDEQITQGLQDMLTNTEISAEQMQAILDTFEGLGYDVQIEEVPFEIPTIDLKPNGGSITLGGDGGFFEGAINKGLSLAFQGATSLYSEITGEEATMPQITLTRKGGSEGGSTYRSNTGKKGGGGRGGSCFVAGTLVTTFIGFSPIEQIKQNDIVLSYNESLHQLEYSTVVQTMIHDVVEPIYTLHIKNEQLRVTGIHRFLVSHDIFHLTPQWIPAKDLQVGDWVFFADGTWHLIHNIEVNIEHQIVYNFEVAGNHNYYVGHNQILAHNKGGSGGKKGKGGGSGGKAKTIEKKEKKEHEKDYYEEVNSQLDKTEKILSNIEKEEDRLIGDKARANQNKQLALLEKEIRLNQEKLEINKQELKDTDAKLKQQDQAAEKLLKQQGIIFNIPDFVLDEDGVVSNFEQISKALDDGYNKLVEKYNAAAAAGNEELTKTIEKQISQFDKYSKSILDSAKRHNELQSEIEDTKNQLEELEDAMEDIRIAAYKAGIEAAEDLKDAFEWGANLDGFFREFDPNSFINSFSIDETPYEKVVEDLSLLQNAYIKTEEDANKFYDDLIAQKKAALEATTDADERTAIQNSIDFFENEKANISDDMAQNGILGFYSRRLEELQKWMDNPEDPTSPFGENTSELFEVYKDVAEKAAEEAENMREKIQDLRDDTIDLLESFDDSLDRQFDKYDTLLDELERMADVYALYYGDDSYAELGQILENETNVLQAELDHRTQEYKTWQEKYEQVLQTGDKELIETTEDLMNDAKKEMLDSAEELAELWVEKFENAIQLASQEMTKTVWGSIDLDDLSTNWELDKQYMEDYKDEYEKAYEIDKLRSKYIDLLNDAQQSSLGTQNKIRKEMQDQLEYLQSQTTVSEYDVKLANAKLEILQKQLALEDAQRNKNKMQLRRDTQGNYRYVYRANEENVKNAQNDLMDSQYDAYELTKNQTITNNDRMISSFLDFQEKAAAIAEKYKDDETARQAALDELANRYKEIWAALGQDFSDVTYGMYDVLSWTVQNGTADTAAAAKDMLEQFYDKSKEIKDKTGENWRDLATMIQDKVVDKIGTATDEWIGKIDSGAKTLQKNIESSLTKIGVAHGNFQKTLDETADDTDKLTAATERLFEAFGTDNKKLQDVIEKVGEYRQALADTQKTTSLLSNQLGQARQTIATQAAQNTNYSTALDIINGGKDFEKGQEFTIKKGTWVWYDRYGQDQTDLNGNKGFYLDKNMKVRVRTGLLKDTKGNISPYPVTIYPTDESSWGKHLDDFEGKEGQRTRKFQDWHIGIEEMKKAIVSGYDTGGYTGDWKDNTPYSKNGKLAVLHQKELVLNASDTVNILSAIQMMRDMTNSLRVNSGNIFNIPNSIMSSIGDSIEQRVEIKAEFPNVSSSDQIEQALLSLADNAYQYAHRQI